jgi:hypothetical protein
MQKTHRFNINKGTIMTETIEERLAGLETLSKEELKGIVIGLQDQLYTLTEHKNDIRHIFLRLYDYYLAHVGRLIITDDDVLRNITNTIRNEDQTYDD